MRKVMLLMLLVVLGLAPVAAQDTVLTDEETGTRYKIEQFMLANFPVGMVFAPDGTLFYNEKTTGNVRMVSPDGILQEDPVITLPTNALQERGMLGLALDPNFENNQMMYVVHTREGTASDWPANTLVRFRLEDGHAADVEELLSVPITNGELMHNGGNVHFDAEGYLYLSLGDYNDATNSQDLETLPGKIHRYEVTDEGLVPVADNPYGNSIYALGFRNPFDFTFDPETNNLFTTEVGPSCDDELDIVFPGFNYGWHEDYQCSGLEPITGLENGIYYTPLLSYTPVISPTGIAFYEGDAFPEWQGDLFFCDWNFGTMRRVVLNERRMHIEDVYDMDLGDMQCRVDLVVGPDDAFYFGTVGEFGGAIMRLAPVDE
ncbi:PQQ-dependent sugar dehydrogenase [Phototrophicus methaneseepsis]|uniref:PQQ-dependent sugar dehydrogenase n=1 Tax=Phototrophicus methaneseepsis TaxID=2710758 RepID=A0A7S8EC41_9CHLR|nr:PQQ-dependent sugar dehydrogenase [Phototrophicus methaneseepsis]QPC84246.1 PQQ-dependent sugar dehydrogenase [Phototrophicus methaneseepsis]